MKKMSEQMETNTHRRTSINRMMNGIIGETIMDARNGSAPIKPISEDEYPRSSMFRLMSG